jgi:BirA family transcriptional regulator, biotin operon repressor / biotin---[acetyl-CoA-carboxylase] ligase
MNIERIRGKFPDRDIDYFASLDSTMRAAGGRKPGYIVISGEQTAGVGRHGHRWHSEASSGLYCSMVLEPAPALTLALGLATAEALTRVAGVECDLRWPNDVLLDERKVAGILVQLTGPTAIAGIGINVNQTVFPPDLAEVATSLRLHTGKDACATEILIALVGAVDGFATLDKNSVLRRFERASSYASGRRVVVRQPEGDIEGTTAGLDPSGFLIVRKDDGTDTLIVAGGVRAAGS